MSSRYWPRNTVEADVKIIIDNKEIPCKAVNFSTGGGALLEVLNKKNINLKTSYKSKKVLIKIGSDNNSTDYKGEILRIEKKGYKLLIAVRY
jgi:hypothetical protein